MGAWSCTPGTYLAWAHGPTNNPFPFTSQVFIGYWCLGREGRQSVQDKDISAAAGKFLPSLPWGQPVTSSWESSQGPPGLTGVHIVPSGLPKHVNKSRSSCLPLRKPILERQVLMWRKVVNFQVLATWKMESHISKPISLSQWRQRFL